MDDVQLLMICGRLLDMRVGGYPTSKERGRWPEAEIPPTLRDVLIEMFLRIRCKARGLVHLSPNRAQQEYANHCSKKNLVLKARQVGITTYVAARFFIQTITQPGTLTVQVAHNQESAEEIFKIVHRFWENLPAGTKVGALSASRANQRQLVFPKIDSEYRVATAADANAGRGLTIHNLHCSEVARWPRGGEEVLTSLRAAVPESGEIVLESTPNGASGVFYEEWQRAEETGYTRHFFPWWFEDRYRIAEKQRSAVQPFTPEEEELVRREGLNEGQIAWRRVSWSQLRGLAAQEYAEDPVSCFKASGECVFDLEVIDSTILASGPPSEMRDNGRVKVWFPPQYLKKYIMGVDPAGGGCDGDYSCAEVIDRETGMQCAELHGHFPPRELSIRVAELAKKYNDALVVVERNNHGHAVLVHLKSECKNLYSDGKADGWLTTAVNRPAMIENLAVILATQPSLFPGEQLLHECRTFVRNADGNTGASPGAHDDCVMAMAIALAARREIAGKLSKDAMLDMTVLPARKDVHGSHLQHAEAE